MHLDVLTLVAMGSFVSACAGAVLLIAWSQNRRTSALALWGAANIISSLGIFCLMLGVASTQPAWSHLGRGLLTLGPGLIWKAARAFDARPAPPVLALLGAAVVVLAGSIPDTRNAAGALSFGFSAVYLLGAATALWLGRKERLKARWPLFVLTTSHAIMMTLGLYSRIAGSLGPGEIPAIISLFGFIHFETIIFTLGTAVFILALVKERNEAASDRTARIDPLTGIANRAAFMESAEQVLQRCRRENAPVSVLMCDLDWFKAINDTHGHAVGDAVIQKFCKIATDALWPNDVFGRIGGEEFAVVLPRASSEASFVRAERIRTAFAESCAFIEGHRVDATVSCGLSVSLNAEHTLSELLKLSDQGLYRAKAEGRNRVKRADQTKPNAGKTTVIRVA